MTFINKRSMMNRLDETKTLAENEPRLEKMTIKDLVKPEVNKKTKR